MEFLQKLSSHYSNKRTFASLPIFSPRARSNCSAITNKQQTAIVQYVTNT